jgi:Tfp pilus assembly protein PilX
MILKLSYLKNESGVALITGLVIMVLLTAIGTYAINMTEIDQTLSANLKASKQAFYLAEAGIERGRQPILASTAIPPAPAGFSENLTSAGYPGSYSVTFPSIMPQGPAWQYRITVSSTGTIGTASKVLQSLVTKTYDPSDAAIAMRGNEAHSRFTGNAFLVDGRDYDHLTGTLTTAAPQLGISVENANLESTVEGALSSSQEDNIQGTGGTATDPSVAVSASLPSSSITSLANTICNAAPLLNKLVTPVNGTLTFSGTTTFGTRTSPQIYCIDGVGTPGNMEVSLEGNFSGAGILVVRNSDLVVRGNFKYEGLIIVTGDKVGFGIIGGGQQDVYGSIMINETNTDGSSYKELVLEGNAAVKRSQSALAYAKQLIPATGISTIISTFPASVQQVSWVEVKP